MLPTSCRNCVTSAVAVWLDRSAYPAAAPASISTAAAAICQTECRRATDGAEAPLSRYVASVPRNRSRNAPLGSGGGNRPRSLHSLLNLSVSARHASQPAKCSSIAASSSGLSVPLQYSAIRHSISSHVMMLFPSPAQNRSAPARARLGTPAPSLHPLHNPAPPRFPRTSSPETG